MSTKFVPVTRNLLGPKETEIKIPKPVNLISAMAFLASAGCSSEPYIAECPQRDFFEGYSDYSSCLNAIWAHEMATGHDKARCFQGIID